MTTLLRYGIQDLDRLSGHFRTDSVSFNDYDVLLHKNGYLG
jgi:hypothetical protein